MRDKQWTRYKIAINSGDLIFEQVSTGLVTLKIEVNSSNKRRVINLIIY